MTTRREALTLAGRCMVVSCLCACSAFASAEVNTDASVAQRMRLLLRSSPRLIGQHRFTVWGFDVYDASLWASQPFAPEDWFKHTLVLELRYLRDFRGRDIAQRSIDEMHGQQALNASQKQNWLATLQALIPSVRSGERLTGVYTPERSMQLWHQDRWLGEVVDAELAQRFFGIWLSPETSQRQLRQQLLANAQP